MHVSLNKASHFIATAIFVFSLLFSSSNFSKVFAVTDTSSPYVFGTLQSTTTHVATNAQAGVRLATVELSWKLYEPNDGAFSTTYAADIKKQITAQQAAGMNVVLELGMQYTPSWVFAYPNSRYVNQFGEAYTTTESGKGISNMIFNQTLRDKQQRYIQRVFQDLGTNFYAVRTGGGWYGELNYPENTYNGHTNAYWAFDQIASGHTTGLPTGMTVNPVPSWIPGTPTPSHASAAAFSEWYMNSLKNYHDWQIQTIRAVYPGKIAMLYPSWGVRPGQLAAAVAVDLNGSTSAEVNGEVQRGFDFERYIAGIQDANVVVYTTWIDAKFGDDTSTDKKNWTPVHFLSSLAQAHPLHLKVWGENTGRNSLASMQLSVDQMKKYNLIGLNWAFEPDLYSGSYAKIDDYGRLISSTVTTPVVDTCPTDINQDRKTDVLDFSILSSHFFKAFSDQPRVDINKDGVVNVLDFSLLSKYFFKACP